MKYLKLTNMQLEVLRQGNSKILNWEACGLDKNAVRDNAVHIEDLIEGSVMYLPISDEVKAQGYIDSVIADFAVNRDGASCEIVTEDHEIWDLHREAAKLLARDNEEMEEAKKQARIELLKNQLIADSAPLD